MAELNFFNVETKVRDLVGQLLEPVVRRAAEDRVLLDKVKKLTDADRKKLEDLEFSHAKAMRKFTLVDEANRRVQDLAATLSISEGDLGSRIEAVAAKVEKIATSSSKHETLYKSFSGKAQFLESEFLRFDELLSKHREVTLREYQDARTQVAAAVVEVKEVTARAEEEVERLRAEVTHLASTLPLFQARIEKGEKVYADLAKTLSQVQLHAVSDSKLQASEAQVTSQINYVSRMLSEEIAKRTDIELFLESHLPVYIQFLISNTVLASADKRQVNKYLAFEASVLDTMRREQREARKPSGIASLKQLLVARAAEMEARRAEHDPSPHSPSPADEQSPKDRRKSKVSFALNVKQVEAEGRSFITSKSNASLESQEPILKNAALKPILQASEPTLLEQQRSSTYSEVCTQTKSAAPEGTVTPPRSSLAKDQSDTAIYDPMTDYLDNEDRLVEMDEDWMEEKVQELVLRTVPALQSQCSEALLLAKTTAETHEKLGAVLRSEMEATSKREKRYHIDVKVELASIASELKKLADDLKTVDKSCGSLADACLILLESLSAVQSLLAQDEEDRQQIQLTGYKEQPKGSKPVLTLNTECLSCSGQAQAYIAAFKMACLNYAPSSVKFAGNLLGRRELLELVGTMVNRAGEKVDRSKQELRPVAEEPRKKQLPELSLPARSKLDAGATPKSTRRVVKRTSLDLTFV